MKRTTTALEFDFLLACHEVVIRQQELLPALGETLGVQPQEIYYTWADRKCSQRGKVIHTDWEYYFHGCECDLTHRGDQRFVRVDFGPQGRLDTFTDWGVWEFVMASKSPWLEFTHLKTYFAETPASSSPYNKAEALFKGLLDLDLVEPADFRLVELIKHAPLSIEDVPTGMKLWDVFLHDRWVVSVLGKQLLAQSQSQN